jgi:CDP-6-deoxy-D-xylo-4-hexulose-3-dehydrase
MNAGSNKTEEDIFAEISRLIKEYFASSRLKPKLREIRTSDVLFDEKEVLRVLKVLLKGWITQGEETKQFEEDFAKYYGVKHAVSVNSGSSANLVAMTALTHNSLGDRRIKPGDEVITSPVTFPTSVFPIIQVGAIPVFVDIEPDTFCMDPNETLRAISHKTKAILPVHLLGHPFAIHEILDECKGRGLWIIEDACESHGAMINERKVGTFGDFGTFSFFAAHHITTGEGGMIITDNDHLADLARSIRAFGRVIEVARDPKAAQVLGGRYKVISPELGAYDVRQTFDKLGYGLKITDLQAAIGIEQLKKLDYFIEARRKNAQYLIKHLQPYEDFIQLPVEKPWAKHTYHHFAIIIREDAPFTRLDLITHLEQNGIETRPIEAGNIVDQPCMQEVRYRVVGELKYARLVRKNGFFVGVHPGLTREDLEYMINVFSDFFEKHKTKKMKR